MIKNFKTNIIVCVGPNNIIGDRNPEDGSNGLLWHVKDELKLFKEMTTGNIIVFGENTAKYVPIEKMKKDRFPIVLHMGDDIEDILENQIPEEYKDKEVFICGGATIYEYFMDNFFIDEIFISRLKEDKVDIKEAVDPVYFPNLSEYGFIEPWEDREYDEFTQYRYKKNYNEEDVPHRAKKPLIEFLKKEIKNAGGKIEDFADYIENIGLASCPVKVYYGHSSQWSIEDEATYNVIIDKDGFDSIIKEGVEC